MPTATPPATDNAARATSVSQNVALIRERLDEIVTREARSVGWSPGDAKKMAQIATLEYFGALTRHAPPEAALRHAIEEADRKYVLQYLQYVAKEGKVSMRHALQEVPLHRLNPAVPRERAALDAALNRFDETIRSEHSPERAVDASRQAAPAAMQAAL